MSQRFRLLTEHHVAALLPPDDLIQAMETALARFSAGEVVQPVRSVLSVGPQKAYFGVMPAYVAEPPQLGAKLVTVFGQQPGQGPALAPGDDPALRPRDRRADGGDGRTLHHRSADGGGLGGVGQGDGSARRQSPGDPRQRRAGAQPPRGAGRGAGPRRRAGVESTAAQPRALRRRHGRQGGAADPRRARRAEDAVRGADIVVLVTSSPTPVIDDAWVSQRRACHLGGRLPARPARDGAGAGGARTPGGRLARRGAGRVRRRRAGDPRGPLQRITRGRRAGRGGARPRHRPA